MKPCLTNEPGVILPCIKCPKQFFFVPLMKYCLGYWATFSYLTLFTMFWDAWASPMKTTFLFWLWLSAHFFVNNLDYIDDTTLIAESKEELKSLLKVKEESEKAGLKLNIQKTKIMASCPITSWQTDGETMETVTEFTFLGLHNHCGWWLQPWN